MKLTPTRLRHCYAKMMNPDRALREAELFFHEQIPVTRAMGVRVVAADKERFVVEAPVALNYNHLRTGFGGSINAVATLAAYGLLWRELRGDKQSQVVIRGSSIRFLQPVRETIRAICIRPPPATLDAWRAMLAEESKARITLQVTIVEDLELAAEFKGTFVALKS